MRYFAASRQYLRCLPRPPPERIPLLGFTNHGQGHLAKKRLKQSPWRIPQKLHWTYQSSKMLAERPRHLTGRSCQRAAPVRLRLKVSQAEALSPASQSRRPRAPPPLPDLSPWLSRLLLSRSSARSVSGGKLGPSPQSLRPTTKRITCAWGAARMHREVLAVPCRVPALLGEVSPSPRPSRSPSSPPSTHPSAPLTPLTPPPPLPPGIMPLPPPYEFTRGTVEPLGHSSQISKSPE